MIFILLTIFAIFALIFYLLYRKNKSDVTAGICICFCIAIAASGITIISNINDIAEAKTVDKQIIACQEQANVIKADIEAVVQQYEDYEKQVLSDSKLATDSAKIIAFAQTYPELRANTLVQNQIKTLEEYNNKLLELKSERAKAEKAYFWLFFGKHPF